MTDTIYGNVGHNRAYSKCIVPFLGPTDRRTDGPTYQPTNRPIDRLTNQLTSYRYHPKLAFWWKLRQLSAHCWPSWPWCSFVMASNSHQVTSHNLFIARYVTRSTTRLVGRSVSQSFSRSSVGPVGAKAYLLNNSDFESARSIHRRRRRYCCCWWCCCWCCCCRRYWISEVLANAWPTNRPTDRPTDRPT